MESAVERRKEEWSQTPLSVSCLVWPLTHLLCALATMNAPSQDLSLF